MIRKGFGYRDPERAQAKERANAIERQQRQAAEDADLPALKERDERPLAVRIGLGADLDLDCELARRREQDIADPNSTAFKASVRYAADRACEHGRSEITERLYGICLRSVDLPVHIPSWSPSSIRRGASASTSW
jgi:hypothetical protein